MGDWRRSESRRHELIGTEALAHEACVCPTPKLYCVSEERKNGTLLLSGSARVCATGVGRERRGGKAERERSDREERLITPTRKREKKSQCVEKKRQHIEGRAGASNIQHTVGQVVQVSCPRAETQRGKKICDELLRNARFLVVVNQSQRQSAWVSQKYHVFALETIRSVIH